MAATNQGLKSLPNKQYSMLDNQFFNQFSHLYNALSPENLSCDGELSKSAIAKKKANLKRQWAVLEQQLSYKVSFSAFEDELLRRSGL